MLYSQQESIDMVMFTFDCCKEKGILKIRNETRGIVESLSYILSKTESNENGQLVKLLLNLF